jgi:site-specific DNA-methyltransferase (adenine-specific)
MRSPNPRPNLTYDYKGYKPHANGWTVSREKMEKLDAEGRLHFPDNPDGRIRLKRFLDEMPGAPVGNVWDDIRPVQSQAAERLGYPTQKPLALLERIIAASSNEGDVVLDPFCGCGTAVVAAQKMNRHWLGIDVTPIATSLIQARLDSAFGAKNIRLLSKNDPAQRIAFRVEGLPTDLAGARMLYEKDPLHKDFEMWAVGLVPAIPQEKKGADGGVDGITYTHDNPDKAGKVVVQVKGGKPSESQIRDLHGTMSKEGAVMAFFVTLEPPTKNMIDTALKYGYYKPKSGVGKAVPVVQIRTIEELLNGKTFDGPVTGGIGAYKDAQRIVRDGAQPSLDV